MHIEYSYYDIASNDAELKDNINNAIKFSLQSISVLPCHAKLVKALLPEDTKLAVPIDYPLGISDLKTRNTSIENAIKSGAQIIDLIAPSYYLCNRKYDKFREDIKSNTSICESSGVEIRYTLEYRIFTYDLLYKVASILAEQKISHIYPSTGHLIDDINDNILASALINKKIPNINIICTGNVWNSQQVTVIQKAKLYGIRVNSINALNLLSKNTEK